MGTSVACEIVGWEGLYFVPGQDKTDKKSGSQLVMTTHTKPMRKTPEEAWADALMMKEVHGEPGCAAIVPVTSSDQKPRARKIMVLRVYVNEEE